MQKSAAYDTNVFNTLTIEKHLYQIAFTLVPFILFDRDKVKTPNLINTVLLVATAVVLVCSVQFCNSAISTCC